MKTKHLLMAGLGLISFVGMSLSSVQKAFGQDRIVQDSKGRFYLEATFEYDPPYIRCTRDAQYCFNVVNRTECRRGICLYRLSLINEKTVFHNQYYASFCWDTARDPLIDSAIEGIDCRIYGAPRSGGTGLEDALDRLRDDLHKI